MKKTVILLFLIVGLFGCAPKKPAVIQTAPTAVTFDKFPVLEYHLIGRPEGRWQRTPENFKKDVEWLYANNYYPMNLRDILDGFGGVPAGKKPVIITFDDSTGGQFRYLPDGELDPDSAAGVLKRFHDQHPDWPLRATFFVLIETNDPEHNLFGQPDLAARKLRQLAEWGMEIGAHTYSHDRLDKISAAAARRSIGRELATLTKFVSRETVSLSLPEGKYPKDLSVLGGFKLVVEVAGGMNLVKFDPLHIKRIQAIDDEWRKYFGRHL
ncbi:MAG: polysaccharide deacetylase family protein [Candidatus Margulisbacteria bacterium]|nr:polysaccharide deacetylase family protein [Candidatus Margulisiibacteriota bacterium]